MNFSDEIRHARFESVQLEAVLNLHFTSNWLFRLVQGQLRQFDISHEQYNILRILRGNRDGAYSLREVQERMLNRTANTTRLVEKLRKRGLVTRVTCPSNRRQVEIRITDEGLDLLDEMSPAITDINARVAAAVSEEDAARLSSILDKLRDRLDVTDLTD